MEITVADITKWQSEIVDSGFNNLDAVYGGVFIQIPRSYLWFGKYTNDGVNPENVFVMYYPNMSPDFETSGSNGKMVKVGGTFYAVKPSLQCISNERKTCPTSIRGATYDNEVGLWHVGREYYKGGPDQPDYDLFCNKFPKEEIENRYNDKTLCKAGITIGGLASIIAFQPVYSGIMQKSVTNYAKKSARLL